MARATTTKDGRTTPGGDRVASSALAALSCVPRTYVAVIVGHSSLLMVAAWWAVVGRRRPPGRPTMPQRRFAVLIPAHNEERLIGSTLDSVAAIDYPDDLYDVHVVADNCTDRTVEIVRARGVEAHDRVAPTDGGKGPALQWLLARLWDRGDVHDAVVIIDADTLVSPNLLKAMDATLAEDASAAQAYYAVRDSGTSVAAGFRAAALAVRHFQRPLGRTQLGGSSGLYGNGMAFRTDLLRSRSWSNHLTEDIEFQLDLLLDGHKVRLAADAAVEAEMPATVEASVTQHERWERGRLDMARRYLPALGRRAVTGGPAGRFAYLDAALDQVCAPFSVVGLATAAWAAVAVVRVVVAPSRRARLAVITPVALLVAQVGQVLSALAMVRAPATVYRSLFAAPRLAAWKLRLWLRMFIRPGQATWIRTARNDEQSGAA
jgi:cellulose synthase/poly-beta-1,6-N-acetylglucosamine synthase-like glycosyltransferase